MQLGESEMLKKALLFLTALAVILTAASAFAVPRMVMGEYFTNTG